MMSYLIIKYNSKQYLERIFLNLYCCDNEWYILLHDTFFHLVLLYIYMISNAAGTYYKATITL